MTPDGAGGLIIVGAGGHGRVVADAAAAMGCWNEIAFLDDRFPELDASGPWPVIGKIAALAGISNRFSDAAVGIGDNAARMSVLRSLERTGFRLPVIAHPSAIISPHAMIGNGSVILARAVVNIGANLGEACIVNTGSIIEHDCRVGHGVHVSPAAAIAGAVTVGDGSWIGIGASVRQCVRIGCNVRIGAGAAVVTDLPDGATAVGVPARILAPTRRN